MKNVVIALAILGSATSVFAAAECPKDSKTLYSCTSTPQEGDTIPADEITESIAVCVDTAGTTSLVGEYQGKPGSISGVNVESRPGGVSYVVTLPEVTLSFELPAGLSPRVTQVSGSLHRNFQGHIVDHTTYTCDIVR